MKRWEYMVQTGYTVPIEDFLNELGDDGWELVDVDSRNTRLIFKREIQEEK